MTSLALLAGLALLLSAPKIVRYREWSDRVEGRRVAFDKAVARAKETGRKLVVIGDPDGGITHVGYDYGDVCIDLTGCPLAPDSVQALQVDIGDGIPLDTDQYVVFVSYVVELVEDIESAWSEIQRIAGSPDNVFAVGFHRDEMATYTYPGVRWVIESFVPLKYEPIVKNPFFARRL